MLGILFGSKKKTSVAPITNFEVPDDRVISELDVLEWYVTKHNNIKDTSTVRMMRISARGLLPGASTGGRNLLRYYNDVLSHIKYFKNLEVLYIDSWTPVEPRGSGLLFDLSKDIKKLRVLQISNTMLLQEKHSGLLDINAMIRANPNLEVLSCINCGLSKIPEAIFEAPHLKYVDLTKNRIDAPPRTLRGYTIEYGSKINPEGNKPLFVDLSEKERLKTKVRNESVEKVLILDGAPHVGNRNTRSRSRSRSKSPSGASGGRNRDNNGRSGTRRGSARPPSGTRRNKPSTPPKRNND